MKSSGTRAALAVVPMILLITACANDDGTTVPECTDFDASAVALTVNSTPEEITCVTPAYSTEVSEGTAYRQAFQLADGHRLLVYFQDLDLEDTEFPKDLVLVNAVLQEPLSSSSWTILCNSVVAGSTLTIDTLRVDSDDPSRTEDTYFRGFEGTIDLTLSHCTVPEWNVTDGAVHVVGDIAWGDR